MIKFVSGDMFEDDYDIRVNTVNCVGVMGAGVALAFKSKYPDMFRAYKKACDEGRIQPGKVDEWRSLTDWVINFPTKRHWRQKSRYEDIESGLDNLHDYLKLAGHVKVAMPALGCGHGGLDWKKVSAMIQTKLADVDAEIYVFEPADSRSVGEKAVMAQLNVASASGIGWQSIDSESSYFPRRLKEQEVERLSVMGSPEILDEDWVTVLMSWQPSTREVEAAKACVEALAGAGVTLCFTFGSKVAHELVSIASDKSARVVLWAAQGPADVQVPEKLQDYIRAGRLAIVTAAAAKERWSNRSAAKARLLQAMGAKVILLSNPKEARVVTAGNFSCTPAPSVRIFYLWYGETDDETLDYLSDIGATRVGRRRETGEPRVEPILSELRADGSFAGSLQD